MLYVQVRIKYNIIFGFLFWHTLYINVLWICHFLVRKINYLIVTASPALRFRSDKEGCCTPDTPCEIGEGICKTDNDCKDALKCGEENCPFSEKGSCCYVPKACITNIFYLYYIILYFYIITRIDFDGTFETVRCK